jgi:hypothetical protein
MKLNRVCLVIALAVLLVAPAVAKTDQTQRTIQERQPSFQERMQRTRTQNELMRSTQQLKKGTVIRETIKTCKVLDPCTIGQRSARTFARALSILVTSQNLPEDTGNHYVESMLNTYRDRHHIDQNCFRKKFRELYHRYFAVYKEKEFDTICKNLSCSKKSVRQMFSKLWNLQDRLEIIEQEISEDAFPLTQEEIREVQNEKDQLRAAIKTLQFKIASCEKPKDLTNRRGELGHTTEIFDYDNTEEIRDRERVTIIERNQTYTQIEERDIIEIRRRITELEEKRRRIDEEDWRRRIAELIDRLQHEKLRSIDRTVIEININRITNTTSVAVSDRELEDRLRELEEFRKQSHKIVLGHRRGTLGNPEDPYFVEDRDQIKREWDFEIEKYKRRQAASRWDLKTQLQDIRLVIRDLNIEIERVAKIPKLSRFLIILQKYQDFYRRKQIILIERMEKAQPMIRRIEDLKAQIRKAREMPNFLRLIYNLDEELEKLIQDKEDHQFEVAKQIFYEETTLITSVQVIIKEDIELLRFDNTTPENVRQLFLQDLATRFNDLETKKANLLDKLYRLANKINRRRLIRYTTRILAIRILYYKEQNNREAVRQLREYLNKLNDKMIEKWKKQAEKRELISKIRIEEDRIIEIIQRQFNYIEKYEKNKIPQIEDAKHKKVQEAIKEEEDKVKQLELKLKEITESHERLIQETLRKIAEQEKCTTATLVDLEQQKDKVLATKRGVLGEYSKLPSNSQKGTADKVSGSADKLDNQVDAISQYILVCSKSPYPSLTVEPSKNLNDMKTPNDLVYKNITNVVPRPDPKIETDTSRKLLDIMKKIINETTDISRSPLYDVLKDLPDPKRCDHYDTNRIINQITALDSEKKSIIKAWGDLKPAEQSQLEQFFRTSLYGLSHEIAELESYLKVCGKTLPKDSDSTPQNPQKPKEEPEIIMRQDDEKLRRVYFSRLRSILRRLRERRVFRVKNDPKFALIDTSRRSERIIRREIDRLEGEKDSLLKDWEELLPKHQKKYAANLEISLSSITRNLEILEEILRRFPIDDNMPKPNCTSSSRGSLLAPQTPKTHEEEEIDHLIDEQIIRMNREIEEIMIKSVKLITPTEVRQVNTEIGYLNMQKTILYNKWKQLRSDQQLPREKDFSLAINIITKQVIDLEDILERARQSAKSTPPSRIKPADELDDGVPKDNSERTKENQNVRDIYQKRREFFIRILEYSRTVSPKKIRDLIYWDPSSNPSSPTQQPSTVPRKCLKATAKALRDEEKRLSSYKNLISAYWTDSLADDQAILKPHLDESLIIIQQSLQNIDNYLVSCNRSLTRKYKRITTTDKRRTIDNRQQTTTTLNSNTTVPPTDTQKVYLDKLAKLKELIANITKHKNREVDDSLDSQPSTKSCSKEVVTKIKIEYKLIKVMKEQLEVLHRELVESDTVKIYSDYNFALHIVEIKIKKIETFRAECKKFRPNTKPGIDFTSTRHDLTTNSQTHPPQTPTNKPNLINPLGKQVANPTKPSQPSQPGYPKEPNHPSITISTDSTAVKNDKVHPGQPSNQPNPSNKPGLIPTLGKQIGKPVKPNKPEQPKQPEHPSNLPNPNSPTVKIDNIRPGEPGQPGKPSNPPSTQIPLSGKQVAKPVRPSSKEPIDPTKHTLDQTYIIQLTRFRAQLREEVTTPHPKRVQDALDELKSGKNCTAEKSAQAFNEHTDLQAKKTLLETQYTQLLAKDQDEILPEWRSAMRAIARKAEALESYLKICPHVLPVVPILLRKERSPTSSPKKPGQNDPKDFKKKLEEIHKDLRNRRTGTLLHSKRTQNCTEETITTTRADYSDLQAKKTLLQSGFGALDITYQEHIRHQYTETVTMIDDEIVDEEIFFDKCKASKPPTGEILPPSRPADKNRTTDVVQLYHKKVAQLNYTFTNFSNTSRPSPVEKAANITRQRLQCDQHLRAELMVESIYLNANRTKLQQDFEDLLPDDRVHLLNGYLAALTEVDRRIFEIESYFRYCPFKPHEDHKNASTPNKTNITNHSNHTNVSGNHPLIPTLNKNRTVHNHTLPPSTNHTVPPKVPYVPKPRKTWPKDPRQPTPAVNCQYPSTIQYEPETIKLDTDLPNLKKELQQLLLKNLDLLADLDKLKREGNDQEFKKKHAEYLNTRRHIAVIKDQLKFIGAQQPIAMICHTFPRITQPRTRQEVSTIENSFYVPPSKEQSAHNGNSQHPQQYEPLSKIMDARMVPCSEQHAFKRRINPPNMPQHAPLVPTQHKMTSSQPGKVKNSPQMEFMANIAPPGSDSANPTPGKQPEKKLYKVTVKKDVKGNTIGDIMRGMLHFEPATPATPNQNSSKPETKEKPIATGMFRSKLGDEAPARTGSTVAALAQAAFQSLNLDDKDLRKTN